MYSIWVKPHPAEKEGTFDKVAQLENVFILEDNLDYLFKYANLVLSIYSTTLYDACRFELPGFSLYTKSCADYVNSIVESGVAEIIYDNQNPVDFEIKNKRVNTATFFSDFDFNKMLL